VARSFSRTRISVEVPAVGQRRIGDHVASGDRSVLDGGRLNGLDPEGSSREIASLTNITGGEDVVGAALQARADEHALVEGDSRAVKKIDVRAHTRGADHQVGGQRLAVVRGDTQGRARLDRRGLEAGEHPHAFGLAPAFDESARRRVHHAS